MKRLIKVLARTLITAMIYGLSVSVAVADDDFILDFLPAIIAATQGEKPIPAGILKIQELNGRWQFAGYIDGDPNGEYYRFDGTTAQATTEPGFYIIEGDSSLVSDFSPPTWCDGDILGSYSTSQDSYLVLCDWGYPDNDLGSAFFFDAVSNSFSITHYFYIPSIMKLSTGPDVGTATRLSNNFLIAENNPKAQNRLKSIKATTDGSLNKRTGLTNYHAEKLKTVSKDSLNQTPARHLDMMSKLQQATSINER